MEILMAKEAGFCFGVKRAVNIAERTLRERGRAFSLGPLIHNPQVVGQLREMGLEPVEGIEGVGRGPVIIRSHGVSRQLLEELESKGVEVVDATCPYVKRAQRWAASLSRRGYFVVVVGEEEHPEVRAIMSYIEGEGMVVEGPEGAGGVPRRRKIGVVAQTTQERDRFGEVIKALLPLCEELTIYNTLCEVTSKRQEEALRIAREVDCMIVVGGRNSANTRRLAELCSRVQPRTYHVETEEELRPEWFRGMRRVGITAGASTPIGTIRRVRDALVSRPFCGIRREVENL